MASYAFFGSGASFMYKFNLYFYYNRHSLLLSSWNPVRLSSLPSVTIYAVFLFQDDNTEASSFEVTDGDVRS